MMEVPSLKAVQADSANTCKGAVVKSYGAERLQGVSKTELNASESLMTCRDAKPESENRRAANPIGTNSEKKSL